MKKAKITILAIAFLAIVGGSLAFKAQTTYGGGNVFTEGAVVDGICDENDPLKLYDSITPQAQIDDATYNEPGACVDGIDYDTVA